jgi:adenosine deaminase CECR1
VLQTLNEKEEGINERLMEWKEREVKDSLWKGTPFPPEIHFFQARPLMEQSSIFKFIRKMPKGNQ